jgi:hypothetical protein
MKGEKLELIKLFQKNGNKMGWSRLRITEIDLKQIQR